MTATDTGATILELYTTLPSEEELCDFCGQPWQAPLWTISNIQNEAQFICRTCLRDLVNTGLTAVTEATE